ncbi:MAG: copper chaperone PCu(A)C [Hahellaceae bacterium]|nr:copper chaperone PCu(A)C [Hahellaceae bacterium]MCP5169260.1 copper chaperone PCu(A)C [Hahellaceae bacterium]
MAQNIPPTDIRAPVFAALFIVSQLLFPSPTRADSPDEPASVNISQAWIRLVPPVARTTAAYGTLQNTGNSDLTLISVSSGLAEFTEMHATLEDHGMMKMRLQEQLSLPAQGELKFAPGGLHIMMKGLKQPLIPGQKVPLDFYFLGGGHITQLFEVSANGPAIQTMP